jgi:glutathione synthase/RimK-type ligase-like ATP-grasp enzyme
MFADSLDQFNRKVWRRPRSRKPARYDLAIFHKPEEPLPPSNKRALNLFLREAKKMDLNAELITEKDSGRLLEFDALFIRQTTSVDNITYRLAQAAEQADMVVIDDPSSIILCTNKVYLKEILDSKSIPSPRSKLIFRKNPLSFAELAHDLGNTMVLKIPDGSFSVGIDKVGSEAVYMEKLEALFQQSSILLAQEFVPTEYDWRIGVLNGESIFACKYYMALGHWQIYRHTASGNTRSGKCETLPVHLVPRRITRMAEKVAGSIGKGFYGVDLKESDKGLMVIEINDNPSIDQGVEDKILGSELYRIILREFVTRLDSKRNR